VNGPVQSRRRGNRRLATRLAVVVVAMFGFGYLLVPLYDVLCEITGLGGRTGVVQEQVLDGQVDEDRLITVEFLGDVNSRLPWEFHPAVKKMQVHPGQVYEISYFARNLTDSATVGQARPSVTPAVASIYFAKTECFCFTEQHFDAGEGRMMPVRFVVARELPADIRTVTLSYTFFNAEART
jgi:cytochrome c oxidase assembly protein subunit 11